MALNTYAKLREVSLLLMAILKLRTLLLLRQYFYLPRPLGGWYVQRAWRLPNFTQDLSFIYKHQSYDKQLPLQRQLHFTYCLLVLPKFQVHWESKSLGSQRYFYYCQPLARHCLLLITRSQSLSAQTFLQAYCFYLDTMSVITMENSLPRQWPTSSLSTGRWRWLQPFAKQLLPSVHTSNLLLSDYRR